MANDYEAAGSSWAENQTPVEGVEETLATPAPETQAPEAATSETVAPTLLESSESWSKKKDDPTPAPADATAEALPPVDAAEAPRAATTSEIAAAIRAQINGKDIDVPENLMIPLKRNGVTEYVPLKDVMASGMMEKDYRVKTAELSRERQEVQQMNARIAAENARDQEKRRQLEEEYNSWQEAKRDPTKLAQWENHYKLMASDPMYKKNYEDAQRARVVEAENAALRDAQETREAQDVTAQLTDQIKAIGAQYPGVSPGRIMQQYGLILKAGEVATFDMRHVHWLYQQEAANVQAAVLPVQSQVETLTKELETLRKLQAATAANTNTDKAIARAKAPNLTPVGSPQSHNKPAPKPYTSDEAEARRNAWARER